MLRKLLKEVYVPKEYIEKPSSKHKINY